ncbi:hypothetical protein CAS74_001893 [Pichia kudriavzevii]|uniref:Core domain-containing protein n=1 Tax=Pichia kudriavzevii TaxID=4909 RepID=A0A1Z8JSP9_PICKU|nr:hypothetical protein CAS74_001893 [Pichia kudriavzevii]
MSKAMDSMSKAMETESRRAREEGVPPMMQLAFPQGPELQHATQTGKRVGQRSVPHSSSRPETTENSLGWLHTAAFFQERLSNHQHLADNYTSTMMTVSTLTSVICNYMLSRHQAINYKKLLLYGNVLQASIFAIMAVSVLIETPQVPYFIFTLFAVLVSSVAACFTQVALMALANIRSAELSNATVVGNAVSGVLPSASMLAGGGRALWYFIASVVIVIVAQLAVFASDWKDGYKDEINIETMEESLVTDTPSNNSSVAYWDLKPIHPLHLVITITFFVTLVFPVFASSVTSPKVASKTFIPLAFFVWNSVIRSTIIPAKRAVSISSRPFTSSIHPWALKASSLTADDFSLTKVKNPQLSDNNNLPLHIALTESAAKKLTKLAEEENKDDLALRLVVSSGGCHGFQYDLKITDLSEFSEENNDSLFERDGGKVIVDKDALEIMRDSKIDYVKQLIGEGFKIVESPYTKSSCGCGSSFDIDFDKLQGQ